MLSESEIRNDLCLPSESNHIEFKAAQNNYDDDTLFKYCVAIGNCGGGRFYLGVGDTPPRPIVGTRWSADCVKKQSQIFSALGIKVEIEAHFLDGKRIVVFIIPSRPKCSPFSYKGAYYTRVGEGTCAMGNAELSAIFNETEQPWESLAALQKCAGTKVLKLLDADAFYLLTKKAPPADEQEILLDFKYEGLICPHGDAQWDITNMGAALFAKNLCDFPELRSKEIRFIRYAGKDRMHTLFEKTRTAGYAADFRALINLICSELPKNEVIADAIRADVSIFSVVSIREIVANSIIHQDFSGKGIPIKIELFTDRIEISNPGMPEIKTERFVDECKSRNERLAGLMRNLGICEERGSGIDRVIFESEVRQLPPPKIDVNNLTTKVTLFAPIPFAKMTGEERTRACYLHACLKYVSHEKMNNLSLRNRFKLSTRQISIVSSIIKDTLKAELIKVNPENSTSMKHRTYLPFWA